MVPRRSCLQSHPFPPIAAVVLASLCLVARCTSHITFLNSHALLAPHPRAQLQLLELTREEHRRERVKMDADIDAMKGGGVGLGMGV